MAQPAMIFFQNQDVGCARLSNKSKADWVFQNLCPKNYTIIESTPQRASRKPYCRWVVKYIHAVQGMSYAGGKNAKEIFDQLGKRTPTDLYIKEKTRSEVPPSFVITYGVRCDCDPDFDFDQTISEQEELLTNVIEVKTETDYELSLDDLQKYHPLFANDVSD